MLGLIKPGRVLLPGLATVGRIRQRIKKKREPENNPESRNLIYSLIGTIRYMCKESLKAIKKCNEQQVKKKHIQIIFIK